MNVAGLLNFFGSRTMRLPDGRIVWGVGIHEDVASASVRSILSAANVAAREGY